MSNYNFKKLNSQKTYRKWNDWNEGDCIVGKFIEQTIDQFQKPNYAVEILEASIDGVELKEGTVLCLNSCASLDKAMERVEVKDIIQVTYTGMYQIQKGPNAGKSAHTVEVAVDDSESDAPSSNEVEL